MRHVPVFVAVLLLAGSATAIVPAADLSRAWTQFVVARDAAVIGPYGIGLDADGDSHFTFYTGDEPQYVFYASPGALPGTWIVEPVASRASKPELVLDGSGSPHIAYRDLNAHTVTKYAWKNGDSWLTEPVHSGAIGGGTAKIRVDEAGLVHVVFAGAGGIKYAVRSGSGWTVELITSEERDFGSMGFDLDSQGNAHVVYDPPGPYNIKYATNEGGSWATSAIPALAWDPDLAVDANDGVHITFQTSAGHLGYAKRNGTGWAVESADTDSFTGLFPSIDTDAQGRPHIAYRDQYGDSLGGGKTRYATKRADGSWALATPAPLGYQELYSEIRVDSADQPVVGYATVHTQGVEMAFYNLMLAEPLARTLARADDLS